MIYEKAIFFSIVISVYNIEEYIADCVESMLSQSYGNFEMILVDDGSSDHSGKICDFYASKDSRIQVIHKENGGAVSARKAGATAASGEYIITVDGDDYVAPDYLLHVYQVINGTDVDMITCGYTEVYKNQRRIKKDIAQQGLFSKEESGILREQFIIDLTRKYPNTGCMNYSICCKVVKRNYYVHCINRMDTGVKFGEDLIMCLYLLNECSSILVTDICDYCYRQSDTSMCRNYDKRKFFHFNKTIRELNSIPYITPAKIQLYAFMYLSSTLSAAVMWSKNYSMYKQTITESRSAHRELWDAAECADLSKGNAVSKIKYFLIKNRFDWGYYIMIKLRLAMQQGRVYE